MATNKRFIVHWCRDTLAEAVRFWHRKRVSPEFAHMEIAELAVQCAWYTFYQRGHLLGDVNVEAVAKRYAKLAYRRFQDECRMVVCAPEPSESVELIA